MSIGRVMKQGWKIDKWKWLLNFMWSILTYVGVPIMVWDFSHYPEINIHLDANTYFAVFAVFLIISICRNLAHPPMVLKAGWESVETREETASS